MPTSFPYPFDLPPLPPKADIAQLMRDPRFIQLLIRSHSALAELKGICRAIENPNVLLHIPILQESVASSEIEGIHTTVETALEEQVKSIEQQDPAAKEALNYGAAIDAGFKSLKEYALSTRTILTIHEKLMPSDGGRFRTQQNQIVKGSQTIYSPPSAARVDGLVGNWESYVHAENGTDILVKTAICHYQFEAIHPFLDGNGRSGRILIVLQLVLAELLDLPILYVSGYLNRRRDDYYRLLNEVTVAGNWPEFIEFMVTAVGEQARTTQSVIRRIVDERNQLKRRLRADFSSIYSPMLLDHIFSHPVTFPKFMAAKLAITYQTASKYLKALEAAGILTSKKSGQRTLYYNVRLLSCLRT